jgi:putative restriction endonuclease
MPTEKTWQQWLERLYNLRRDKRGSHERPHKPVLLLAILDLLDRGLITKNEVHLTPDLENTFDRYFEVVRQRNDKPTIQNPFYHLCGDGFWHLVPKPGERLLYEPGNVSGPPSLKKLREIHARFDDGLWSGLLTDPHARHDLREALISRYLPQHRRQLAALAAAPPPTPEPEALKEEFHTQRDAAFRKIILQIYDFTCSACGMRVKLDDLSLVEAAHIIPREESEDDRPNNGLALCPNHHRAMDRCLIAPCPHGEYEAGVWKIASRLDARIPGHKDLAALAGQRVIRPNDPEFYPDRKSLEWREARLNTRN